MGRGKNRSRRREKERQMGFFNNQHGGHKIVNLNRHPHCANNGSASETLVKASDAFKDIRNMFIPKVPEISSLVFSELAWVKINCYIRLVGSYEVTGFGKIENGIITDIKIIKQSIKSTLVDSTCEQLMEFIREVGGKEIAKWSLDWHSHVEMGTSPSGTDTTNWREQHEARDGKQFPVMIINKRGSVYCHCYMGDGDSKAIDVKYLTPTFTVDELRAIYDGCAKDVEEKCTRTSYSSPTYPRATNFYGQGYDDGGYNYAHGKCDPPASNKIIIPDSATTQKITRTTSGVEIAEDLCCFCGEELLSPTEKQNTVCTSCFEKYNCEDVWVSKCPVCGDEMDDDETKNGICDGCLEEPSTTEDKK